MFDEPRAANLVGLLSGTMETSNFLDYLVFSFTRWNGHLNAQNTTKRSKECCVAWSVIFTMGMKAVSNFVENHRWFCLELIQALLALTCNLQWGGWLLYVHLEVAYSSVNNRCGGCTSDSCFGPYADSACLLIGCKVWKVGKKTAFSGSESFSMKVLRMSRSALALRFGRFGGVEALTFRDGCWDCHAGFLIGLEALMSLIRTEDCDPCPQIEIGSCISEDWLADEWGSLHESQEVAGMIEQGEIDDPENHF